MKWLEDIWAQIGFALPVALPCAVIALIIFFVVLGRDRVSSSMAPWLHFSFKGAAYVLLAIVALTAVVNYTNMGRWRYNSYLNAWEFYHYYMGTKYAREVGYTGMYGATLAADRETGLKYKNKKGTIRDLATGRHVPIRSMLKRQAHFKSMFSAPRWREFVKDVEYFKRKLSQRRWNGVLSDKGYNGTPPWSALVGGFLSNIVPTSSKNGMLFLALLDPILIGLATGCVWWAFGLRTVLFMIALVGTHYMMHFSHMKGSFLRTDFAMCLVMAVCFVKKDCYKTAGALLGYSIVSRIFPVVFLFGIGAKLFWDFVQERRINRQCIGLFVTCGLTVAVISVGSVGYFGGLDTWKDFENKISKHNSDVSPWRIGFKQLIATDFVKGVPYLRKRMYVEHAYSPFGDPDPPRGKPREAIEGGLGAKVLDYLSHRQFWVIQACMLLLSLYLVKGLKTHQALIYGMVPCFFLATPTYYYYIMLCVPLLFFAPEVERPSRAIGLAMMFVTGMIGYGFFAMWRQQFATYYWLSWLIFFMCVYMMAIAFAETRARAREAIRKKEAMPESPPPQLELAIS